MVFEDVDDVVGFVAEDEDGEDEEDVADDVGEDEEKADCDASDADVPEDLSEYSVVLCLRGFDEDADGFRMVFMDAVEK